MVYYAKEINGEIKLFSGQKNGNILAETKDSSLVNKKIKIIQEQDSDVEGNLLVDAEDNPVMKNVVVLDEVAQAAEDASAEENKYDNMRSKRNKLLADTDHIMMSDYPMADKSAIEAYRQELRDLPSNISDIDNVVYPVKP